MTQDKTEIDQASPRSSSKPFEPINLTGRVDSTKKMRDEAIDNSIYFFLLAKLSQPCNLATLVYYKLNYK